MGDKQYEDILKSRVKTKLHIVVARYSLRATLDILPRPRVIESSIRGMVLDARKI